jgi:hypothetical protein
LVIASGTNVALQAGAGAAATGLTVAAAKGNNWAAAHEQKHHWILDNCLQSHLLIAD